MKILVGVGCLVIGGVVLAAAKPQSAAAVESDSRIGRTTTGLFRFSATGVAAGLHDKDPLEDVGVEQMKTPNIAEILKKIRASNSSADAAMEKLRDRAQSESAVVAKRRSSRRKSKPKSTEIPASAAPASLTMEDYFVPFTDNESAGCPSPKTPLPPLSPR